MVNLHVAPDVTYYLCIHVCISREMIEKFFVNSVSGGQLRGGREGVKSSALQSQLASANPGFTC